ncbi:redoxin domain-containing protein [Mesohalobacter halotolerans]|uniref:Redoxin domain-containing protein n=1 Tax=Mesohalobacter halotolerans TaxID=1883405 RepID=A0A4U5TNL5_9FLAO|nr:redoxin domain-containing protein [Mesohalobacter halotolerans]MBS3738162.1 redoxin family protein [Psychroflexus sp.]TKS55619.1 redoxin domain-containing protein [Mesohalobacter halotolerans]
MNKLIRFCCIVFLIISCKKEHPSNEVKNGNIDQTVEVNENIPTLNYSQLKPWLNKKDNTTYVVNFWATWCAPCVKELPYFENVSSIYKDQNVKVILVSLDFPKMKNSRLIPYVKKENIQPKVLHLDDTNEQFWINDIAQSWSGAIPATLIYNKDKRKFYEQSFTQEELETEIQTFIN